MSLDKGPKLVTHEHKLSVFGYVIKPVAREAGLLDALARREKPALPDGYKAASSWKMDIDWAPMARGYGCV